MHHQEINREGHVSLRATLEELGEFDTALLANTIDHIDPTPPHAWYMAGSIHSLTPTLGPTVGVAFTCEVDTSTPGSSWDFDKYWQQLEQMSQFDAPIVWVVKAVGSRPDHECIMGDGMAKVLHNLGCVGVVTDGGLRDVEGFLSIPFAAYAKGRTIHYAAFCFRAINRPVEIGGITVRPGEVIHANPGGVIKIPSSCLDNLAARAAQWRALEHEDDHLVRSDLPLPEIRQRLSDSFAKSGFGKSTSATWR